MTTSTIDGMIRTFPSEIDLDRGLLAQVMATVLECGQACSACADACLSEKSVADLRRCIRTDLDCADLCGVTARVLSRHTEYDATLTRAVLAACAQACRSCGDECESHAKMHEHCRICAEVCRRCEQACNDLLATI